MSRSSIHLRPAGHADAPVLAGLWAEYLRRADHAEQVSDTCQVIETATADPGRCVAVAEYDGEVAGAVLLVATTISQVNLEPVVQAIAPHVLPQYRRRGVGRALMEAAVTFAEERGIGHVGTAASTASRDANRFMARLALGPRATVRRATTSAVRAKLTALRPATVRTRGRSQPKVLAARRTLRRQRASADVG